MISARIKRVLKAGANEYFGVFAAHLDRAIAVMYIKIQNGYAVDAGQSQGIDRCDGDAV